MLMVISPHLDDAVLACGALLAAAPGSATVTVLCGAPPDAGLSTAWDRACGFASAAEAIAARIEEDRAAHYLLGAEPAWLPFCDAQYGEPASPESIGEAITAQIARLAPARIAMPLGLFHSDHRLVARACLLARERDHGERLWLAYEDALYRRIPGLVQERVEDFAAAGILLTPEFPPQGEVEAKREAALCYASQRRPLRDAGHEFDGELRAAERYWRLDEMAGRT